MLVWCIMVVCIIVVVVVVSMIMMCSTALLCMWKKMKKNITEHPTNSKCLKEKYKTEKETILKQENKRVKRYGQKERIISG